MKRKLINSFIILSASSAISKLFSILNRMLLTRLISPQAMTLYLLIVPTLSLCITLGQLGIPSAVFRLISHPRYNNFRIIINSIILSLFSVIVICLGLSLSSHFIANNLLKNSLSFYPIMTLVIFIPLVAISGILKNFYLAKRNMFLVAKTQLIEELARLIFVYLFLKNPLSNNDSFVVTIAYLSMSVGEFASIIYMLIKLKTKYTIPKIKNMNYDGIMVKDILNISLPLTGSRLYHCLVSFLEPITLLYVLSKLGFSQEYIHNQYAIMSGYVISLLVTPTFFNNIIYRLYLPIATNDLYYHHKNTFKHFYLALLACFLISLPFTIIFYFFPKASLQLIYNTTNGYQELKYMSIPFTLFYLQTPLSVILHAKNKNKDMFIISIIECTLEICLTYGLSYIYFTHSILVSLLLGMLFTLFASAWISYKIIKDT